MVLNKFTSNNVVASAQIKKTHRNNHLTHHGLLSHISFIDNNSHVFHAQRQISNDYISAMDEMDDRDFARFELKMGFVGISHILYTYVFIDSLAPGICDHNLRV